MKTRGKFIGVPGRILAKGSGILRITPQIRA